MHERSETIQNKNGKWVNVYGKGLLKQGKVLPILYPWFEQEEYDTEKQAVAAAKQRSDLYKEDEPEKPVGTRTKPVDDDAPKKMRNTEEKGMFSSGNKIIDVFALDNKVREQLSKKKKYERNPNKPTGHPSEIVEEKQEVKPGYKLAKGGGFWSVDTKSPHWQTEKGYKEAVKLYGYKPAWVNKPKEKEEFVNLKKRPSL